RAWPGVLAGVVYARRPRSSPPLVVRAISPADLRHTIEAAEAERGCGDYHGASADRTQSPLRRPLADLVRPARPGRWRDLVRTQMGRRSPAQPARAHLRRTGGIPHGIRS